MSWSLFFLRAVNFLVHTQSVDCQIYFFTFVVVVVVVVCFTKAAVIKAPPFTLHCT